MKVDSTISEKNVSIASEYYRLFYGVGQEQVNLKNRTYSGGGTGFIPFKISITLDGISGFKIYQKLKINTRFLPAGYAETIDFIVTGVDHKLKDNDWETEVKCVMMPKFEEYTEIVTTDLYTYVKAQPKPTSPASVGVSNTADNNSSWAEKVRNSIEKIFPGGSGGVSGRCAEWVTKFVKQLTNDVKGTNLPIAGGYGSAWQRSYKDNVLATGIYELKASYTLDNGNALTPAEAENLINSEINKNAEYGDVLQYYLSDGNIGGNKAGVDRPNSRGILSAVYHVQEFTGTWYTGKRDSFGSIGAGWTSSWPANYGSLFVYGGRVYQPNDKFEIFWLRVKDEYRK